MRARLAIVVALCLAFVRLPAQQAAWLSGAQSIAPGVDYFTSADKTLVDNMGQVSVRVRATDHPLSRMEVLAPELTAAQAEEMRRALVDCACRPAEGGVATYVVNFGR